MFLGILLRAEGKRTPGGEKMPEAAWMDRAGYSMLNTDRMGQKKGG